MKKRTVHVICSLAAGLASMFVLTACYLWAYQPEVPEELLNKKAA